MPELTVFIPAGGLGTRLAPHTLEAPKPLLVMGDSSQRLIDHPIGLASQCDAEIVVSTDYHGDQVAAYLEDRPNVKVVKDSGTVGSGGSLRQCFSSDLELSEEGLTLVLPSDHIYEELSLEAMTNEHQTQEADITLLTVPPKPHGEYVELSDGRPERVVNAPSSDALSTTGIFLFSNRFLLQWMRKAREADRSWNVYGDIVCPAIGKESVAHYFLDSPGFWEDAGTIRRYYDCNMRLSGGKTVVANSAVIHPGANLEHCVVMHNTIIDEPLFLADAIISSSRQGARLISLALEN